MKLFARPASPFVRKVRVMARETGLDSNIEEIMLGSPEETKSEMPKYNPLGKIPALILDDGSILYESKVICEYMDSLHDGAKFFPSDPDQRWPELLLQGLADGMGDAIIVAVMEAYMRPDEFKFEPSLEFQLDKVRRSLAELNSKVDEFKGRMSIGPLAVACSIGYLDFRFPDLGWKKDNPDLLAWYDEFCERPSMKATHFTPPT